MSAEDRDERAERDRGAQPDAMRHDIAGRPTSPVSADDRMAAQRRVLEIRRERKLQADIAGISGTQQG